jgi:hypothetical protein
MHSALKNTLSFNCICSYPVKSIANIIAHESSYSYGGVYKEYNFIDVSEERR